MHTKDQTKIEIHCTVHIKFFSLVSMPIGDMYNNEMQLKRNFQEGVTPLPQVQLIKKELKTSNANVFILYCEGSGGGGKFRTSSVICNNCMPLNAEKFGISRGRYNRVYEYLKLSNYCNLIDP